VGVADSFVAAYHDIVFPGDVILLRNDGHLLRWPCGFEAVDTPVGTTFVDLSSTWPTFWPWPDLLAESLPYMTPGEIPW